MLNTDLYKEMAGYFRFLLRLIVLKEPIWGAYTELYAGLSTDITTEDNGVWSKHLQVDTMSLTDL